MGLVWEQRKLKDISNDTLGGGTPSTKISEYWNGDIPWLQSSNVLMGNLNTVAVDKYISDKGIMNSAAKLVEKDSIAVVTRVGVGKLAVMHCKYTTSQDFLNFSKLNGDITFLGYLLYRSMKIESEKTQGTSIKGITKNDILSIKIKLPSSENEQFKVGLMFKKIDTLIAANECIPITERKIVLEMINMNVSLML